MYNHGVPRTIRSDQARCLTGKEFETSCTQNNIELMYAPANDHRAIGLVECLIQTIKRQLSCMKAHLNKKFNLEQSIHAIIQRLRISKQKTTKTTPFEAHFERRCNAPVSNITTKSNNTFNLLQNTQTLFRQRYHLGQVRSRVGRYGHVL